MAKPVSLRQFAKLIGASHTAVNKAVKNGRLTLTPDGKIDPDTAREQWDAGADGSKRRDKPEPAPEQPSPVSRTPTAATAYATARAIREEYNARNARLEYEQKAGKLVAADKVRLESFQAARLTRDTILNVPNKIAHELAAETDPAKVHVLLTKALNVALEELAAEGRRRAGIEEPPSG
jgi:hypothetical protein